MSANIFSKTANAVNSGLDLRFLEIEKREQFSHYTEVKSEINLVVRFLEAAQVELTEVKLAGITRWHMPRAKRRHIRILMPPCCHFIINHSETSVNACIKHLFSEAFFAIDLVQLSSEFTANL